MVTSDVQEGDGRLPVFARRLPSPAECGREREREEREGIGKDRKWRVKVKVSGRIKCGCSNLIQQ